MLRSHPFLGGGVRWLFLCVLLLGLVSCLVRQFNNPTENIKSADPLADLFVGTPPEVSQRIVQLVQYIYTEPQVQQQVLGSLDRLIEKYRGRFPPADPSLVQELRLQGRFSEKNAFLITYADHFTPGEKNHVAPGEAPKPLDGLLDVSQREDFRAAFSHIHLLPFFTTEGRDRGFDVIDYQKVDDRVGTWEHVGALATDYELMFDYVCNHVSHLNPWFQDFLQKGDASPHSDWFLTFSDEEKTRRAAEFDPLLRPRPTPVLSSLEEAAQRAGVRNPGPRQANWVWTTFSPEQVDLNFESPAVFEKMTDVLLDYASRGAQVVRLDAVTYLWKKLGTSSAHLPETHAVVQLWRAVLDAVVPQMTIITETNVDHPDNISYFGSPLPLTRNGAVVTSPFLMEESLVSEAQMVYNFALPPLVLQTMISEDASVLRSWAQQAFDRQNSQDRNGAHPLRHSADRVFFNFLDSHDGIGVQGAKSVAGFNVDLLVRRARERGGAIGPKVKKVAGKEVREPYELNVTWWDALNPTTEATEENINRYLTSRFISFVLPGVPAVYAGGLFALTNSSAAQEEARQVELSHDASLATQPQQLAEKSLVRRAINRGTLNTAEILKDLQSEGRNSRGKQVFLKTVDLLKERSRYPAFAPSTPAEFPQVRVEGRESQPVFAVQRGQGANSVFAFANVSAQAQSFTMRGLKNADGRWVMSTSNLSKSVDLEVAGGQASFSLPPFGYAIFKR